MAHPVHSQGGHWQWQKLCKHPMPFGDGSREKQVGGNHDRWTKTRELRQSGAFPETPNEKVECDGQDPRRQLPKREKQRVRAALHCGYQVHQPLPGELLGSMHRHIAGCL